MSEAKDGTPAGETAAQSIFRTSLEATWNVGRRLAYSRASVAALMPMSPDRLDRITEAEEERLDVLLFRFSSAFSMIQYHLLNVSTRPKRRERPSHFRYLRLFPVHGRRSIRSLPGRLGCQADPPLHFAGYGLKITLSYMIFRGL